MSKYMVCVVGRSAPTAIHSTLGEAMREAERLSLQTANIQSTVHVVRIECSLLPKINHVWQLEAAQPDVETKKED
jgi:hypothetical protein